jgi:cytoskeletal protein CcmA (bactofilin family)
MFGKKKDKPLGKGQVAGPSAAVKVAEPEQSARTPESLEKMSSIGSGMTVVGKLVGDGVVKIFGNVEGEVQASAVLICEGAYVEGNVIAKELTVGGRVKGTMHAIRAKLQGTAVVEGDIYHQSLAIEENARFEGTSHRGDNLPETPSGVQAKGSTPQPKAQAEPQAVLVNGGRKTESVPIGNVLRERLQLSDFSMDEPPDSASDG